MVANKDFCCAEYIWIDGDGGYRSKTKVFQSATPPPLSKLPEWNFDGSSTKQAPGHDSEVIIKPVKVYYDPFRGGNNILVLTDCYTPQGEAIPTNTRAPAKEIFDQAPEEEPWFGIEQEYTLFKDGTPLGWPHSGARAFGGPVVQLGFPGPQGPYYCSAGADVSFGRPMIEKHLLYCLQAGLNISGINAEVMPGQWEYQVGGPGSVGLDCADDMIVSRYILNRVGEEFGIVASLDPKPIPGDWNGAGCHTNFSTKKMREVDGAVDTIFMEMMDRLGKAHKEHIAAYGVGNERRLTGAHETANINTFLWGVANRGASIRIGNETKKKGKGYFEDRRPASNMDPYVVTSLIFKTCIL